MAESSARSRNGQDILFQNLLFRGKLILSLVYVFGQVLRGAAKMFQKSFGKTHSDDQFSVKCRLEGAVHMQNQGKIVVTLQKSFLSHAPLKAGKNKKKDEMQKRKTRNAW